MKISKDLEGSNQAGGTALIGFTSKVWWIGLDASATNKIFQIRLNTGQYNKGSRPVHLWLGSGPKYVEWLEWT